MPVAAGRSARGAGVDGPSNLGHPSLTMQRPASPVPTAPPSWASTARDRVWSARAAIGSVLLVVGVAYLVLVTDLAALSLAARDGAAAVAAAPLPIGAALLTYAAAFGLRAWTWHRVLPTLSLGQAWAGLHVSLLGNHVLPLRLGEALRVTSVVRRTDVGWQPALTSTVLLRLTDLMTIVGLALLFAPAAVLGTVGVRWSDGLALGFFVALVVLLAAAGVGALLWLRRRVARGFPVRLPGAGIVATTGLAWLLEATVLLAVSTVAGLPLSYAEAVGVTAVTIVAQTVAVTPGGFGSYEAAGTAALVAAGVPVPDAFAAVLLTHAVKTGYALLLGALALVSPAPGWWGRWRLPVQLPPRPAPRGCEPSAPVVVFLPAHDEEHAVGEVVRRLPREVDDHPVRVLVIDDGSTDATAAHATAAGAMVVGVHPQRGLGAAVRRGLAEAVAMRPACVVYLDADAEYDPADLPAVATPVLAGDVDYVVGSRFAGSIDEMRPHRRAGNLALTAWVRWMTRRRDLTDGQSGYRAFSPAAAAAAEVVHDYNYAQVLTLDLLAKGFIYAEVPIRYSFRTSGTSFIRLGRYLRRVLPAVHAELNDRGAQSSTT